jgi:hypothetical protein
MERPEEVQKVAKTEENETSQRLFESVAQSYDLAAGSKLNIARESQKIADIYDFNQKDREDLGYDGKIIKATERLSADLKQLNGNMKDYNRLLKDVSLKIPDEPAMNPQLVLKNFSEKTGTYSDVAVIGEDGFEAYRIVQPGNTFNQIIKDSYRTIAERAGEETPFRLDEYRQSVVKLNNITDPDRLSVGQAIKLRENFAWG